jgi:hypothetical protein
MKLEIKFDGKTVGTIESETQMNPVDALKPLLYALLEAKQKENSEKKTGEESLHPVAP